MSNRGSALENIDPIVKRWSAKTRNILRGSVSAAGIRNHSGDLQKYIRYSISRDFGIPWKIGFQFPRHGVFVEKGVGRGHPIGRVAQATAAAKGRRNPKPWFNPVMEVTVPELANDLNLNIADEAMKHVSIK